MEERELELAVFWQVQRPLSSVKRQLLVAHGTRAGWAGSGMVHTRVARREREASGTSRAASARTLLSGEVKSEGVSADIL